VNFLEKCLNVIWTDKGDLMDEEWTHLIDALKDPSYELRVSNGDKWLVWDCDNEVWIVYSRLIYKHNTTVLIETPLLSYAINELVKIEL